MEPGIPGSELGSLLNVLQGGGNAALVLACYFIWKAERRLSRIEKALDLFLQAVSNQPTLIASLRDRLRGSLADDRGTTEH